jgi:hypothetical protein
MIRKQRAMQAEHHASALDDLGAERGTLHVTLKRTRVVNFLKLVEPASSSASVLPILSVIAEAAQRSMASFNSSHRHALRFGNGAHALADNALADNVVVVHASNVPPNTAGSHQSLSGCRFTTRILRRPGRSGSLSVEGVDCYLPMRPRIVVSIHYA